MIEGGAGNPDYERKAILQRLGLDGGRGWDVIHVARAPGQAAVEKLQLEGVVRYVWGEGKDAGIMLVSRALTRPSWPRPSGGGMRA